MYANSGTLSYARDQGKNEHTQYIHLAGSLLAIRASTGGAAFQTRYQHTDALGSPVAETSSTGQLIERTVYEPYGGVVNRPLRDGPGYTGHVTDASTGLSYMQQRYMDPELGMFLSVDPVTAYQQPMGQFNRYRYGNSNPYTFTEPDGLVSKHFAQDLGRIIKAAFKSSGDKEKFEESLEHDRAYQREADQMKLEFIVDTSRVGPIKDLVEIGAGMTKGESVTDKATGVAAGDVASKVTESALDGKIGSAAAKAVGAVAGKIAGDVAEAGATVRAAPKPDEVKSSGGINLRDKN